MEEIVSVKNLVKKFHISVPKSILERILNNKKDSFELTALNNINFTVKKGEILALIGPNGSGKSTLLRILAGIYKKSSGSIKIRGRTISLIGLGEGFKSKLSMKENIKLTCKLYGLNSKQIKEVMPKIIKFSELEAFTNTKLYQFSKGMVERLAFSIIIFAAKEKNPDIILLDEILAVGDEYFKEKSLKSIQEIIKSGVTVIMASHELNQVKKNATRVILLDRGKIISEGKTKKVIKEYLKISL